MNPNTYNLIVSYKGKPLELCFVRQNGTITQRSFNVHSKDGKHKFSIKFQGVDFEVYNIKSNDTTNRYFKEMADAINSFKAQLI